MPPKKDAKKGGEAEPELGPEEMLLRSKLRIESLERELVSRSEAMNKAVAEQMKMRQKVAEFHQDFVKEKQDTFAITSDMTRQYKQMQEDLLRRNNEQQLRIEDLQDQVLFLSLIYLSFWVLLPLPVSFTMLSLLLWPTFAPIALILFFFQLQNAHSALVALTKEKDRVIELKVHVCYCVAVLEVLLLVPSTHLVLVQEQEIVELKEKMEDMAVEFGEMLKDTLDKMSERIEATASEWNASSVDDGSVQKKLDELSLH